MLYKTLQHLRPKENESSNNGITIIQDTNEVEYKVSPLVLVPVIPVQLIKYWYYWYNYWYCASTTGINTIATGPTAITGQIGTIRH